MQHRALINISWIELSKPNASFLTANDRDETSTPRQRSMLRGAPVVKYILEALCVPLQQLLGVRECMECSVDDSLTTSRWGFECEVSLLNSGSYSLMTCVCYVPILRFSKSWCQNIVLYIARNTVTIFCLRKEYSSSLAVSRHLSVLLYTFIQMRLLILSLSDQILQLTIRESYLHVLDVHHL